MSEPNHQQVIFTNEARCRDCYRCVRVCPIKAIKVENNQACVDATRCISCGTCVRECPQGAKMYRRDISKAQEILKNERVVAASLAPAFAGVFEEWEYQRIPAALRCLGFKYVAETAVGAYLVARDTAEIVKDEKKPHICTACPAVVNYIEKYEPDKIVNLVPLVSPMMAHAKHIKTKFGTDTKVIFIGPCAAKKAEAERREFKGLVDCVLTFEELEEWFKEQGIDLGNCEESSFDEEPFGKARLFPVEGGSIATSAMDTSVLDERLVFISGFDEIRECFQALKTTQNAVIVEPLLCPHGCVNGPGTKKDGNPFERRSKIIKYAKSKKLAQGKEPQKIDLSTNFKPQGQFGTSLLSEEKIRAVLDKTGKARVEYQLNCGACGYPSCRDQAMAVVMGMAETEMCIPYMRRLAEQRSDRIMETSPNAIVILDQHLDIINSNPAFGQMFRSGSSTVGKHISQFMDPDPFEKVASGQIDVFDETTDHAQYGVVLREVVYALRSEHQYVGMFINITSSSLNAERLKQVKDETVQQARELYAHQIEMAKDFANFLGEYTAKGEQLVEKLIKAVKDKEVADDQKDA